MPVARIPATVEPAEEGVAARAAPAGVAVGAAPPKIWPEAPYVLAAYGFVLIGWLVGWVIAEKWGREPFQAGPELSVFVLLYVFAQAIERVLEPLARFGGAATDAGGRVDKEEAVKQRAQAIADVRANDAAKWQAVVDRVRSNTATALWALASVLAMLVSGWLGVRVLTLVGVANPPVWLDVLITGLVIGAGTKPLHDLIKNIEKSKEKKEDPTETA